MRLVVQLALIFCLLTLAAHFFRTCPVVPVRLRPFGLMHQIVLFLEAEIVTCRPYASLSDRRSASDKDDDEQLCPAMEGCRVVDCTGNRGNFGRFPPHQLSADVC